MITNFPKLTGVMLFALCAVAGGRAHAAVSCNPSGNQLQMNQCASDDLAKADAELNHVYQQALAANKAPAARGALRVAQRHWLTLRDADLAAKFPLAPGQNPRTEYGSSYTSLRATLQAQMTRDRTAWLRTQFVERNAGTP